MGIFGNKYDNQLTEQSVRWLVQTQGMLPNAQKVYLFVEPGYSASPHSQWFLMNATGEFSSDEKLGILIGKGKGHAFFNTRHLQEVLGDRSIQITNFSSLVKAFQRKGYTLKEVKYVEFES